MKFLRTLLSSYIRPLVVPLLIGGLLLVLLWQPMQDWLTVEQTYDEAVLQEWLTESRGFREALPGMVEAYLDRADRHRQLEKDPKQDVWSVTQAQFQKSLEREKIETHLETLGTPSTRMYSGQLPLFPVFYRIAVHFDDPSDQPIVWDSNLPLHPSQYREMTYRIHPRAVVVLRYQLHAYNKRQRDEELRQGRQRQLMLVAVVGLAGLGGWMFLVQRRERERERQQMLVEYQAAQAELRQKEAEQRHEEVERKLLEQQLATQLSETQLLEMRSQLYASIGIMAGSYAHNIKNLLVRPNDLLRRCLEAEGLSGDQSQMLLEVRQTLGTVTERLQQILRTVQRDPARSEMTTLDLAATVKEVGTTWKDLAWDKWKLQLTVEIEGDALPMQGDPSHLMQVVENLLFNARDATFEMRNHLRDEARRAEHDGPARRQALIAAAAWKGQVWVRARRDGEAVVLEVTDNGIGMTEEVKRRCTETHFSTKRDNAAYEGHSTGMGLGLSFVVAIVEHHGAQMEIISEKLRGATFRIQFRSRPSQGGARP